MVASTLLITAAMMATADSLTITDERHHGVEVANKPMFGEFVTREGLLFKFKRIPEKEAVEGQQSIHDGAMILKKGMRQMHHFQHTVDVQQLIQEAKHLEAGSAGDSDLMEASNQNRTGESAPEPPRPVLAASQDDIDVVVPKATRSGSVARSETEPTLLAGSSASSQYLLPCLLFFSMVCFQGALLLAAEKEAKRTMFQRMFGMKSPASQAAKEGEKSFFTGHKTTSSPSGPTLEKACFDLGIVDCRSAQSKESRAVEPEDNNLTAPDEGTHEPAVPSTLDLPMNSLLLLGQSLEQSILEKCGELSDGEESSADE